MRQIYFNETNVSDLGLIPLNVNIPSPKPKLYYVDIPGRNGKLDVTNFMGEVKYQNINIVLNFESLLSDVAVRESLGQYIGSVIELTIETIDYLEIYEGRITEYTCKTNNSTTSVSVTIDASPEVSYVSN